MKPKHDIDDFLRICDVAGVLRDVGRDAAFSRDEKVLLNSARNSSMS